MITPEGLALLEMLAPVHTTAVRKSFLRNPEPGEAEMIAAAFQRLSAITGYGGNCSHASDGDMRRLRGVSGPCRAWA